MDNEDSLNLTIGEDEAKLLQGEVRIGIRRLSICATLSSTTLSYQENDDKETNAAKSVSKTAGDGKETKTDAKDTDSVADPNSKAEDR